MKTLIAVMTCHKPEYQSKIEAQRATWVKDVRGADLVFFKGLSVHRNVLGVQPPSDEVWLDVDDGYKQLKLKTTAIVRWALQRGYEYLWKLDDDVYISPDRLLALPLFDYCGAAVELPTPATTPANFFGLVSQTAQKPSAKVACKGWLYGLSRRSMMGLLEPERRIYSNHEDIWVGQKLFDYGIEPFQLGAYLKKTHTHGVVNGWPNQVPPLPDNHVIASCEYTAQQLSEVHSAFSNRSLLTMQCENHLQS